MGVGFLEDHLNVLGISFLQLLLQVAAAVLVLDVRKAID